MYEVCIVALVAVPLRNLNAIDIIIRSCVWYQCNVQGEKFDEGMRRVVMKQYRKLK
jgi:hypothetical protein